MSRTVALFLLFLPLAQPQQGFYTCNIQPSHDVVRVTCSGDFSEVEKVTYTVNGQSYDYSGDPSYFELDPSAFQVGSNTFSLSFIFISGETLELGPPLNLEIPEPPELTLQCSLLVGQAIVITCTSPGSVDLTSASYTVNSGTPQTVDDVDLVLPLVFTIPLDHPALVTGGNSISYTVNGVQIGEYQVIIPPTISCDFSLLSLVRLTMNCSASKGVNLTCLIDNQPLPRPCDLVTSFDVRSYEPGDHTLLVTALHETSDLSASSNTTFTSPLYVNFTCYQIAENNTFDCKTLTNPIEGVSCSLAGYDDCDIPLYLDPLSAGEHVVYVSATDVYQQTLQIQFPIIIPPSLSCDVSSGNDSLTVTVNCMANTDKISCLYDFQRLPFLPCGLFFEVQVTDFSTGPHFLLVVATDPDTGDTSEQLLVFTTPTPTTHPSATPSLPNTPPFTTSSSLITTSSLPSSSPFLQAIPSSPSITQSLSTTLSPPSITQSLPTTLSPPSITQSLPTTLSPPSITQSLPTTLSPPSITPSLPTTLSPPSITQSLPTTLSPPSITPSLPTTLSSPSITLSLTNTPSSLTTPSPTPTTLPSPLPDIDLHFVGGTPRLFGGEVYAEFAANRSGLRFHCRLLGYSRGRPYYHEEYCSGGTFRRTGVPPGDYTLTVIAMHTEEGDVEEIERKLRVHSQDPSHPFCSVYLINRGWRAEGGTLVVEFAGTGVSSHRCARFECSLDGTTRECFSPFRVVGLGAGEHCVRIKPLGCGRWYQSWELTFSLPL